MKLVKEHRHEIAHQPKQNDEHDWREIHATNRRHDLLNGRNQWLDNAVESLERLVLPVDVGKPREQAPEK